MCIYRIFSLYFISLSVNNIFFLIFLILHIEYSFYISLSLNNKLFSYFYIWITIFIFFYISFSISRGSLIILYDYICKSRMLSLSIYLCRQWILSLFCICKYMYRILSLAISSVSKRFSNYSVFASLVCHLIWLCKQ